MIKKKKNCTFFTGQKKLKMKIEFKKNISLIPKRKIEIKKKSTEESKI